MQNKEEHLADWIQLINSENVGPITFYKLKNRFGSVGEALKALPKLQKFQLFPRGKAELEVELACKKHISLLSFEDPDYPENLKCLEDAPPVLYALGKKECLKNPLSLSIVGARNASINGRKTAARIAFDLTNNHVMVVSGMARGIDSSAHKGAMYANQQHGQTIAVLGTGIDVPYPKENTDLYEQIASQGLILSEFLLGTTAQPNNFPRRNRIVAALTLGTLVVEASSASGSLITARLALEQGKDIFAIPGAPNDSRAAGPNKLIKDGAVLVENADDILSVLALNNSAELKKQIHLSNRQKELPLIDSSALAKQETLLNSAEKTKMIDYISFDGVYVDEVIRASGKSASEVALDLLELEMSGQIVRQAGNKVARIK